MKEKQYVIQGVKLRMGEMTLGQDKKLLELMNGREINFEEMKGLQGTISYLLKNDILNDFLKVILKGDTDSIDIDEITNSELEEIISDFFGLNGKWISKLNDLLNDFLKTMKLTTPLPNLERKPRKAPTTG
ncbi:MAG: hypothetical protein M0R74_12430 [Dehalococcoidia bacterium]|nr:hypothetical protein [Dehalococcoidia bacterium]